MEEALFLFDKTKTLIEIIPPEEISDNEQTSELNGLITHYARGKYKGKIDEAQFFGMHDVDDDSIFLMYKIDKKNTGDKIFETEGTYVLFDDLKGRGGVMRDRRPQNESAYSILTDILSGTGWQVGQIQTSSVGTSNYYYISKIEAFWDFLEKWDVEFRPRMTYSKGKITGKYIDIYDQLSADYGKWYEKDDKLLTVVKEEDSSSVYTAFIGRGKGEESGDGYGRAITFEDVEWSTEAGDPVDKPLGQDYVEIPWATAEYGYEDGSPRYTTVEFSDEEDKERLLRATYEHGVNESRPKAHFKSSVIERGLAELGEIVTIISDEEDIRYKTRIFRMKRDFKRKNVKTIEFGDKLVQSRAERTAAVNRTIKDNEQQSLDWLNNLRQQIVDSYFNEDGYNYDLQAGNEYDLPGGYYSFNRPIDQDPTKVIYMGAGQLLIANSKKPNGEWDWRTAATGDGLVADVVNTGTLNADLVGIVSKKANITMNENGFIASHEDGTQTRLDPKGLYHREGGTNYSTHYLMEVGTKVVDSQGGPTTSGELVTLPSVFRGKQFKVILGVADVLSYQEADYNSLAMQRLVAIIVPNSINHSNGTFRVYGYARMINVNTGNTKYVPVQLHYTAIV